MMKMSEQKIEKILVVAITRMGDMLQASPSLAGLRAQYPDAMITVLIEKQFAAICEGIPGVDETFAIDLSLVIQALRREGDGIIDAYKYFDEVLKDLRARSFDMCINMSSSGYTAILLRLLEIPDNRGWMSDDEGFRLIENPWAMLFAAFVYHSNRDFNSINLVDILRCSAGVSKHPHTLVYNVSDRDKVFPDQFFEMKGIKPEGPVIAIQAGASQEKRQWAPARFGYLARLLIERLGATVVLTGSNSESRISNAILEAYSHPNLISAVGQTDLGQLAALLERTDILITGDTGTMHLAVAVGTPVVSLFLASALCFETGPYSAGNLIIQPQIHCNPCNPNLPCSRPDCHDQVSPELVFRLVELRHSISLEEVAELRIGPEIADPIEVAIYGTVFDEDGFLDFKQLNGIAARKGYPGQYYQAARDSYRRMWKSEFGQEMGISEVESRFTPDEPRNEVEESLSQIIKLCDFGRSQVSLLERYIKDVKAPAHLLGETNAKIGRTDENLEKIGLSQGAVGALVRMFIMERENLRGEDPLVLATATRQLYDSLARRSLLFWEKYRVDYGL